MLEHSSRMLAAERSPDVNSYVDDLARQMLEVCAKYGVDHWSRLGPLVLNGSMPMEDVALVKKLRLEMREAMRDNRVPAHERGWRRRGAESSIREALEVMRAENVFGPEAAAATFGLDIDSMDIPPVPFSRAELERARELGQFLVFRVSKAADGTPLSLRKMGEILTPRFAAENKGAVLRNTDWCKDEPFFKWDAPTAGWALVSREVVPNTASKNFLRQTEELVRYLRNEAFKGAELPKKYADAIAQFDAAKSGIAKMLSTDLQKAAEKLESLDITSLTRQSPAEAAYDAMITFDRAGVRHLPGIFTWTSRLSADALFVCVGDFDPGGLDVGGIAPGIPNPSLGASLSRR